MGEAASAACRSGIVPQAPAVARECTDALEEEEKLGVVLALWILLGE